MFNSRDGFVAADGVLLETVDGGASWKVVPSPTFARRLTTTGPRGVWVTGFEGPFHFDGRHWSEPSPPTATTGDSQGGMWYFIGPPRCWMLRYEGWRVFVLYGSRDGGASWSRLAEWPGGIADAWDAYELFRIVSAREGWMSGACFLSRTTDGGLTWHGGQLTGLLVDGNPDDPVYAADTVEAGGATTWITFDDHVSVRLGP